VIARDAGGNRNQGANPQSKFYRALVSHCLSYLDPGLAGLIITVDAFKLPSAALVV
jgi:hypothetical protein